MEEKILNLITDGRRLDVQLSEEAGISRSRAAALMEDQVYMEIQEKTGASSATISRVRRNILENSKSGAMREVITRLGKQDDAGNS